MIGMVIVSHSARLAEGVCELAGQVSRGAVRIAAAGGTDDPANPIGTDAFKVVRAIESVDSEHGVLVLMDLGSAVLSAETAIELLSEAQRQRVRLCPAPLVEGAVAAAGQAAAGAGVEEILREAGRALAAKEAHGGRDASSDETWEEALATVPNRLGLHARPASKVVRMVRGHAARVTVENLTRHAGPADAGSISEILGLGVRQGHRLRIRGRGAEAHAALSELADFIGSGCGESETAAPADDEIKAPRPARSFPGQWNGLPASAGIAVGPLARVRPLVVDAKLRAVENPEAERQRLFEALRGAREETRVLFEWHQSHAGPNQAGIFDAQLLMLEDAALIDEVTRTIMDKSINAEYAWQVGAHRLADRLAVLDDPYLRARAADVTDVAGRVLGRLGGAGHALPILREPSILAAHDLTPSDVQRLQPALCAGIVLETGSALSHSVILARAMGIPVVVGLGPEIAAVPEGTAVAMDGEQGTVWISPGQDVLTDLESRRSQWLAHRSAAETGRHKPAATRDGRPIRVFANISGVAEAAGAVNCGAGGVGVLRTEFLFLGRMEAPGEAEQLAAYLQIASALGGRPLIIRTLDIGGDKSLPYVEIGGEANPFLGWRGIRVTLSRRDLFRTQLRAILRAGAETLSGDDPSPVSILLPMITSVGELREAKAILAGVKSELESERLAFQPGTKLGVMIEAPAAVAVADQLAREADFLSIGTNDLTQYVMAADRTNPRVAALADPLQPAVLRGIRQSIDAARDAGIDVAVCGELAADPLATPLLLGLGLEEFSVSSPLIPDLKQSIARWRIPEAEAIAQKALRLDSSQAVRRMLADALGARL